VKHKPYLPQCPVRQPTACSDSLLDLVSVHLKCDYVVALTQVSEGSLNDIAVVSLPLPHVCLGQYPIPTIGIVAPVQNIANFSLVKRRMKSYSRPLA
jgi:hypothetical protein